MEQNLTDFYKQVDDLKALLLLFDDETHEDIEVIMDEIAKEKMPIEQKTAFLRGMYKALNIFLL